MIPTFSALNLLLLISSFLLFRLKTNDRRLSLSLVQVLLALPLLAGEYLFLAYHLEPPTLPLLLFSEGVFVLLWSYMLFRLCLATMTTVQESIVSICVQILIGAALLGFAAYCLSSGIPAEISNVGLVYNQYGLIYIFAFVLLIAVLMAVWRLEKFWRALEKTRRWEYKFLMVGSCLVSGALVWATSYRITYLALIPNHLLLLAALLFIAWIFILYAVSRHRLLNRKMFVSRKIVYSFVAPSIFALYLCLLGIVSLIMKTFGLSLPFVLQWLFLVFGLIAISIFAFSGKLRRRVQFFISTHFYINKYEYRDEWLALSRRLQGTLTEAEVVRALHEVLTESLYTTKLVIWLGDKTQGYHVVLPNDHTPTMDLSPNDPLVTFLNTHPYFYLRERKTDETLSAVERGMTLLSDELDLALMVPLLIGDQLVGLIGLGPEFTGGRYAHDDFDLLTALGTQAASALLSVRTAEKLAHARERQVWDKLSAFVLHDIKNAASMLSLVRENAPGHIHDPLFQQDMLEAVDNALVRMSKVQTRLDMVTEKETIVCQDLDLGRFLNDRSRDIGKKLVDMEIKLTCDTLIQVNTDPELFSRVLENLLLNAFEAGGENTITRINTYPDNDQGLAIIEVTDNGPGIPDDLLPDALFEPFKTTKPRGTGIGLWQARQLMTDLKGTLWAENLPHGGSRFIIRIPLVSVGKLNS
ncbi:MAG: XrtA/PEP-CTERM system histidine kinase PrsK [Desulfatiglans sp.]|jgi:putative PEP-CTERM system histidine kinase|nr:XrtA/PEP-CTERM system histidine kinase PrsK [Desulfatiglans sp.]